ncbi:MAG: NAD(P)H-hydrate epimerase [Planctomycetaceae bacterium]|nr:NAD(P)H-hydrate epimerase [Planctomycetaceae bacterium]
MSFDIRSLLLTREQSRAVDRQAVAQYGMTGLVLMENAGRGCADWLRHWGVAGTVVVCCGKGNNAGDGFVIARHLDLHEVAVRVLLWCSPDSLEGDALANYRILQRSGISVEYVATAHRDALADWFSDADWIVDALLGTGARGEPRSPFDEAISIMNQARGRKLAIDVPSGLDCDTGEPAGTTFVADYTCTLVAAKPGLVSQRARPFVGQLQVVGIGLPRQMMEELATLQDAKQ